MQIHIWELCYDQFKIVQFNAIWQILHFFDFYFSILWANSPFFFFVFVSLSIIFYDRNNLKRRILLFLLRITYTEYTKFISSFFSIYTQSKSFVIDLFPLCKSRTTICTNEQKILYLIATVIVSNQIHFIFFCWFIFFFSLLFIRFCFSFIWLRFFLFASSSACQCQHTTKPVLLFVRCWLCGIEC